MYGNDCCVAIPKNNVPESCESPIRRSSITQTVNEMREITVAIRNQQYRINKHFFSGEPEANKQERNVDCFASALEEVFAIMGEIHEQQSIFAEKSGVNG